MMARPMPKQTAPRNSSATAISCFSGAARNPITSATIPKMMNMAAMKKSRTTYSDGVGLLEGGNIQNTGCYFVFFGRLKMYSYSRFVVAI